MQHFPKAGQFECYRSMLFLRETFKWMKHQIARSEAPFFFGILLLSPSLIFFLLFRLKEFRLLDSPLFKVCLGLLLSSLLAAPTSFLFPLSPFLFLLEGMTLYYHWSPAVDIGLAHTKNVWRITFLCLTVFIYIRANVVLFPL